MSAGRPARSPGVTCHGLMKPAEGLLNAGVEVARRLGAVLDCRHWVGRELCQPCPGLVGDRTGLVALGAMKAIVRVWMLGVGHGDHPGSRSERAARPAPRSGGTLRRRPGQPHPLPPAGSSRPAGDVTSREICQEYTVNVVVPLQRANWRARQTAINASRSLKRWVEHPKFCGGGVPRVSGRGGQGTMAASGDGLGERSELASAPQGPLGSSTAGSLGCNRQEGLRAVRRYVGERLCPGGSSVETSW
jgi:hypothetical protein